jgi:hypothetical protein
MMARRGRKTGRTAALRSAADGIVFVVERDDFHIECTAEIRVDNSQKFVADPFAVARECGFEFKDLTLRADLDRTTNIVIAKNVVLGHKLDGFYDVQAQQTCLSSLRMVHRRLEAMAREVGPPESFGAQVVRVGAAVWVKKFLLDGKMVQIPEMLARAAYSMPEPLRYQYQEEVQQEDDEVEEDDGEDEPVVAAVENGEEVIAVDEK